MKFDYQKFPGAANPGSPWIIRPIIRVRLAHQGQSVMTDALIDSGADVSLFHASLARKLGLDPESGVCKNFYGISGEPVPGYFHEITLQIVGMNTQVRLLVAFTEAEGVSALLGQADFFEAFRITFERRKQRMEIDSFVFFSD